MTKHAGTHSARVRLAWHRDRVTITVADDGRDDTVLPRAARQTASLPCRRP
ncbi:hypothetical protein [Streptomyces sp. QH1-20]|uniref:hypothetical protein n=1 Tax=Streptomyces sp. QH1-20 TaxID=3240934 RepID=UPI0035126C2E